MENENFQWWNSKRQTSEVYLRTNRKDWFNAVEKISQEIKNAKSIIDIGSGDGHSTRQILANTGEHDFELSLLEPSKEGLEKSKQTLKEYKIVELINKRFLNFLKEENNKSRHYDVALLIQSNYYLGDDGHEDNEENYVKCLEGLTKIADKIIILTAPKNSAYYKVIDKNPFGNWVFPEFLEEYYIKKGFKVKSINSPVRFYVGDLKRDYSALIEFWKFIKNTEKSPSEKELKKFISEVNEEQEDDELNFKDVIIVIQKN